jgi:hypothetical protein
MLAMCSMLPCAAAARSTSSLQQWRGISAHAVIVQNHCMRTDATHSAISRNRWPAQHQRRVHGWLPAAGARVRFFSSPADGVGGGSSDLGDFGRWGFKSRAEILRILAADRQVSQQMNFRYASEQINGCCPAAFCILVPTTVTTQEGLARHSDLLSCARTRARSLSLTHSLSRCFPLSSLSSLSALSLSPPPHPLPPSLPFFLPPSLSPSLSPSLPPSLPPSLSYLSLSHTHALSPVMYQMQERVTLPFDALA